MSYLFGYLWYLISMYLGNSQEMGMFVGVLVSIMVAKNAIIHEIRRK